MEKKKLISIGVAAKAAGVEVHTIRFWTEEFSEYIPFEIGKGKRRYFTEDSVKIFKKINHLIHAEGIRIRSIKEKKLLLEIVSTADAANINAVESLKSLLLEIKALLKSL